MLRKESNRCPMKRILLALALYVASANCSAQMEQQHAPERIASPRFELFSGVDLNYADVNFTRLYDLLINLTPGFKFHLGNDWLIAANAWVPILNEGYASRFNMTRLNLASVSKELHFNSARQHFKVSAGLFSRERWGVDLKWMFPVNSWFMVNAQAGLTSHWALAFDMHGYTEHSFDGSWLATAVLGANFYLTRWNTEFRLSGGRYINKDYGCQLEILRHFRHCSVSVFGLYHEKGDDRYSRQQEAGGFKVVMMLPPYKQKRERRFVVRPASNFRLTYIAQSDGVSMRMYNTDPEENERVLPMRLDWGTGSVASGLDGVLGGQYNK